MFDWVMLGPRKYLNFQSEAKVEQIIAIVTTCSVSCCIYFPLAPFIILAALLHIFFSKFEAVTEQKIKFSIKDFFSRCYQIRRKLRIWSHFLKKSLMENFAFLCSMFKKYIQKFHKD